VPATPRRRTYYARSRYGCARRAGHADPRPDAAAAHRLGRHRGADAARRPADGCLPAARLDALHAGAAEIERRVLAACAARGLAPQGCGGAPASAASLRHERAQAFSFAEAASRCGGRIDVRLAGASSSVAAAAASAAAFGVCGARFGANELAQNSWWWPLVAATLSGDARLA